MINKNEIRGDSLVLIVVENGKPSHFAKKELTIITILGLKLTINFNYTRKLHSLMQ